MTARQGASETPYARTVAEGRQALRQTLLDAASRLLTEHGPQALTMRRIAEEVGCSTMVLYTMFQNKQNLANALYLEGFGRLQRILEAVPRGDDPFAHLSGLAQAYRASAHANPHYYSVMFGRPIAEFEPPPESRAEAAKSLSILLEGVKECIAAGIFRPEDPMAITEALWAAAHGAISLELAGYFPDEAAADRCFRNLTSAAAAWFVASPAPGR